MSPSRSQYARRRVDIGALLWPPGLLCSACALLTGCGDTSTPPFVATPTPLRIVSANDGDTLAFFGQADADLPDSITVLDLSPDAPPVTRTVSGTVPNNIGGAPYSALVAGGRYAFIPSHSLSLEGEDASMPNQVSVVDLDARDLDVIAVFPLPPHPWQALAHPDGERAVVISDHQFHVFRVESGRPRLVAESDPVPMTLVTFDISPDGTAIVATASPDEFGPSAIFELHLFRLEGNAIHHVTRIGIDSGVGEIDQPCCPRFSPDGSRVLVLNGLGAPFTAPLDAVLSIDMTAEPPRVTEALPNVAQGLESLAFHPSGRFAVICCIDGPYVGHLALIDLTAPSMRLLYYLPIAFVPEGIEFSPDGSMLFVQATSAHHIVVYDVDGMKLVRKPYVLHTGEGPSSMALSPR